MQPCRRLDFNYEPDGTVDRGQMAAFITRALAHTAVRPAGVSAQFDGAYVVVSVRGQSFRPVSGAAVDVFWASANRADSALSTAGRCSLAEVTQADLSSFACEIDDTDPVTGSDGDATVEVIGLRRVPAGGAAVWAWTGQDGDTVAVGTDLYRLDVAEGADIGFASTTLVTTAVTARKVRIGGSALYTMQLRDIVGKVSTGVNGTDPARWSLSVKSPGQTDPDVQTIVSDGTGAAAFSIGLAARPPGTSGDLTVTYTLTPTDNAPSTTISANGTEAASGTLTFNDEPSSIAAGSATVVVETRDYVHVLGGFASNSATVTVLDQYGAPFRPGAKVKLASSLSGVTLDGNAEFPVDGRGSHRFAYQYSGPGAETETLTPSYGATSAGTAGTAATVYWAADAGPSDSGGPVLAGDVRRRQIVVDDSASGETPVLLVYDDNDRFNLRGSPTTMAVFEAVLADALTRSSPGLSLSWSNYRPGSERRVTEYSLT